MSKTIFQDGLPNIPKGKAKKQKYMGALNEKVPELPDPTFFKALHLPARESLLPVNHNAEANGFKPIKKAVRTTKRTRKAPSVHKGKMAMLLRGLNGSDFLKGE